MSKRNQKPPSVRLAFPANRPIQLRYFCPNEQREVRISTGTRDRAEAEAQKRELEAKLLLGISGKRRGKSAHSAHMAWEAFREEYRECQLSTLRPHTQRDAESRLDIAESILRPRVLADMADTAALAKLQARLLAGDKSRFNRPRSPHTVKSNMRTLLVALNWAYGQGWLERRPRVQMVKTSKLRTMKGRPLQAEEFERMLLATPAVVGEQAAASWAYLLRGLWESALQIDELMHLSWDLTETIRPIWQRGRLPVLAIPAALQKSDTEEAIPLPARVRGPATGNPRTEPHGLGF